MSFSRVFLGGLLSSRARLRFPRYARSATRVYRSSSKMQRTVTVELLNCLKKGRSPNLRDQQIAVPSITPCFARDFRHCKHDSYIILNKLLCEFPHSDTQLSQFHDLDIAHGERAAAATGVYLPFAMAQKTFNYHTFLSHNGAQKSWARKLASRLRAEGLFVFFDEDSIKLGEDIIFAIEKSLRSSRHILLVLSPAALRSEWVALELSISLYRDPSAAARAIIPILREDCEIPLTISRLRFLDARVDEDFESQVRHLVEAIDRVPITTEQTSDLPNASTRRISPFVLGGTIDPTAQIYIERETDTQVLALLQEPRSMCVLWGPRQSGKSSLLARALSLLPENAKDQAVFIDLSGIGGGSYPQVLFGIAERISDQLRIDPPRADLFLSQTGPALAFSKFMRGLKGNTVIVLDEIDFLRSIGELESFSMLLRSFSAHFTGNDIRWLISSVLHPRHFIENRMTSPFNVGVQLRLQNFTYMQFHSFFLATGLKVSDSDIAELFSEIGGQPFMTQVSAYLLREGASLEVLLTQASRAQDRFGMHLDGLRSMLERSSSAKAALIRVLKKKRPAADGLQELVELGVLNENGGDFTCRAYQKFFSKL